MKDVVYKVGKVLVCGIGAAIAAEVVAIGGNALISDAKSVKDMITGTVAVPIQPEPKTKFGKRGN